MLATRAEASGYTETSLHADVMRFLAELAARSDPRFHLTSFGTSPGGRDLPLVVVSAAGVRTPAEARARGLPVVLVINGIHAGEVEGMVAALALVRGIHAGEVEGKEALLMLVRDLLAGAHPGLLDGLTLLVAPLYNPDGNDRLDLPRLTGQIGPERVGTRVNAAGINLNRDYLRQAAPEMQALATRVLQVWQPDLTIDTHATNGSVHRFAMTYDIPHTVAAGRPEPIEYMRAQMMPAVTAALARDHGLLAGWYGNFAEDERALDARVDADPAAPVGEGWMTYPHHPRFGSNYRGLTGRLDLLLECYSYLPFADRVRTTYATLLEALRYAAGHVAELVAVVAQAAAPRDRIAVRSRIEPFAEPIEIPTRTPRTLDGAPTAVRLRHVARFVGTTIVDRPPGYIVPAAVAAHLERHGLVATPVAGEASVEIATVTGLGSEGGRKILEAAHVGELQVEWRRATRQVPDGSFLVRTDHRLGAIAVYLCEPESDDGAIENGLVTASAVGDVFPIWRAQGI